MNWCTRLDDANARAMARGSLCEESGSFFESSALARPVGLSAAAGTGAYMPALILLAGVVGGAHRSGVILARLGRMVAARSTTSAPAAAVRHGVTASARGGDQLAGLTSRMSQSATRTGSESRSGTWVTSRQTCTEDSSMPRWASRGTDPRQ
jgi:hypothetical protein